MLCSRFTRPTLASFIFFLFASSFSAISCDLSHVTLNSATNTGNGFTIDLNLCVGGGVTGTQLGADADTRTFTFNFFGSQNLSISSFTPSLTSQISGETYPGVNFGPFLNSNFAIGYIDQQQSNTSAFACVNDPQFCGARASKCYNVVFQTNMLPDSIRVVGIEGNGNPQAGCYNIPDMLIDFTANPTPDCSAFYQYTLGQCPTVLFFDGSTSSTSQIVQWNWDFGDGTTSTQQNPSHTYAANGIYLVCLTVISADSCVETFCDTIPVNCISSSTCQTLYQYTLGNCPTVSFFDGSQASPGNIVSWNWDFGDGTTSTQQNPSHTYAANGVYIVCLTTTSSDQCVDTFCDTVPVNCISTPSCQTAYQYTLGNCPTVSFFDGSQASPGNIVSWNWDFGDGTTSTQQNPSHTYAANGVYIVCLTTTSSDQCVDTFCDTVPVNCISTPSCQTAYQYTLSNCPSVAFFDGSTSSPGNIVSWNWDFGDGTTSTQQNPSNTYAANGVYITCLTTISSDQCTDTYCDTIPVSCIQNPCSADFDYDTTDCPTIVFTSTASGSNSQPIGWQWAFGDGNDSFDQHPSHTYTNNGSYQVCQTVLFNDGCEATHCEVINIDCSGQQCTDAPIAVCQNHLATLDSSGQYTLQASDIDNGSTYCSLASMSVTPSQFDCNNLGDTILVTLTVVDTNAQSDSCSALVVVSDQYDPFKLNLSMLGAEQRTEIIGSGSNWYTGITMKACGDINNDGIGDIFISANAVTNGPDQNYNYVYFGTSNNGPEQINLNAINGTNGFFIQQPFSEMSLGMCGGKAGDVNGDGIDDFLIGGQNGGGPDSAVFDRGVVFVIFGKSTPFASTFDLSTLNGSNGFQFYGANSEDVGEACGCAGDYNNDGIDDFLAGADNVPDPQQQNLSGAAYLVFGRSQWPAMVSTNDLNVNNGFTITGTGTAHTDFRELILGKAGDINGDGIDDCFISASGSSQSSTLEKGNVFVLFGGNFPASSPFFHVSQLNGSNGFIYSGSVAEEQLGFAVDGGEDLNDDGFDDLIVGAFGDTVPNVARGGVVNILFGRSTWPGTLFTNNPGTIPASGGGSTLGAVRIEGGDHLGSLGFDVSVTGDLNNDGKADLLLGAPGPIFSGFPGNNYVSKAYVIFSQGASWQPVTSTANLNANTGRQIIADYPTSALGFSLDGLCVNDSLTQKIAVAAPLASPGDSINAGSVFLICDIDVPFMEPPCDTCSPPIAICHPYVEPFVDQNGVAVLSVSMVDSASTAPCGLLSVSVQPDTFTCGFSGPVGPSRGPFDPPVATLTVVDSLGDTAQCSTPVFVIDSFPPNAICIDTAIALDASGNAVVSGFSLAGNSTDNCDFVDSYVLQDTFNCSNLGVNSITVYVLDFYENFDSCVSQIQITDPTGACDTCAPPVASCLSFIPLFLDGTGSATVTPSMIDAGSIAECGLDTMIVSPNTFNCSHLQTPQNRGFSLSSTLTVIDVNGDSASCVTGFSVNDTISPTAICSNATKNIDSISGIATISISDIDNGSTDNCAITSLSISIDTFTCADTGANVVVLTLSDAQNNVSSCSAIVTITDKLGVCDTCDLPTASCVSTITLSLDNNGQANLSVTDVDNGSTADCGLDSISISQSNLTCNDLTNSGGAMTITLTVADIDGNVANCTTQLQIQDTTAPTAICTTARLSLDTNGVAVLDSNGIDNGSSDNCLVSSYSVSKSSFGCGDLGSNTVTMTVTDQSGNASSCTANVEVTDELGACITCDLPVASCQNTTVYLDDNGVAEVDVSEVDNGSTAGCGLDSIYISLDSLPCDSLGSNLVVLTVIDSLGFSSTCSANVTVEDTTAPQITCPSSNTFNCGTNLSYSLPIVENCDSIRIIQTGGLPSGSDFPDGVTVNTFVVNDGAGLTTSCGFTVTIVGGEPPDTINPKLSNFTPGFLNKLGKKSSFGAAMTGLGDLNNDGFIDVAIGASAAPVVNTRPFKSSEAGDVFIMFLDSTGFVLEDTVIGEDLGIPADSLHKKSKFGSDLAGIGDLDNDGVEDMVIGEPGFDPKKLGDGTERKTGAVVIAFLNSDGTIKNWLRIKRGQNGLSNTLSNKNLLGSAVASIGDLDGDGIGDIAVGAEFESPTGPTKKAGAVYILFMNTNGTVKSHSRITDGVGGLPSGTLAKKGFFGSSVAPLNDVDGDGVNDLAVGGWGYDAIDANNKKIKRVGAVFVLLMNTDGTARDFRKISYHATKLPLTKKQSFGLAMARVIDIDSDGIDELAVGSPAVKAPGKSVGSVTLVSLLSSGDIDTSIILPAPPEVEKKDFYGISLGALNDVCFTILGVGAQGDDDGEKNAGAVYISIPIQTATTVSKMADSEHWWADEDGAPEGATEIRRELERNIGLSIYPNPNEGTFRLTVDGLQREEVKISVMNSLGDRVFYSKHQSDNNSMTEQIKLPELQGGVYFVQIEVGDIQVVERVLIF